MRIPFLALIASSLVPSAAAQGFNVDVGPQLILAPTPASTFPGAGGQPGFWNGFQPAFVPAPLRDLAGQLTGATLYTDTTSSLTVFPSVIPAGGDQALMEDLQWSGGLGFPVRFRFEGLAPGAYHLFVYGAAPNSGSDSTEVEVIGSPSPLQTLSGPWPGSQILGVTYSRHAVAVADGILEVELRGLNPFPNDRTVCNGMQLVPAPEIGIPYCSPAVPNSTGTPGQLVARGSVVTSDNILELAASQLPAQQFGFFIASRTQGFLPGAGGSQGNLCLAGSIARFNQPVLATGPSGTLNQVIDLTAIPLNPNTAVQPGETWNFQAWHRDIGGTSNFTSGVFIQFL